MSASIASTTCLVHEERAAAARCPSCRRFFCSECITEHDGKLTCAICLNAESEEVVAAVPKTESGRLSKVFAWVRPFPIFQLLIAITLMFALYLLLSRVILSIPNDFHEGTIWEG